jgi:hypothetical protein
MDSMLDMSIEALTPPPMPKHRPYGIGASDVAKLLLSLGRRPMEDAPRWLREEVEPMKRMGGHARFLLQKAGRVKRRTRTVGQQGGIDREGDLFCTWMEEVESGVEQPLPLDPHSLMYATALPSEFPPFTDKECPRLVARIDAWARTLDGALVLPSLKCAHYGYDRPAWWNGIEQAPWYYALQSQAEMAICGARHALLVIGCGWLRDEDDPRGDGDIKVLRIDRDETLIAEIRQAVEHGWAVIESLRAK